MQKHDVKNAGGSSGSQQPGKKTGTGSDSDNQKPMQKRDGDRTKKSDEDLNSPQRNK